VIVNVERDGFHCRDVTIAGLSTGVAEAAASTVRSDGLVYRTFGTARTTVQLTHANGIKYALGLYMVGPSDEPISYRVKGDWSHRDASSVVRLGVGKAGTISAAASGNAVSEVTYVSSGIGPREFDQLVTVHPWAVAPGTAVCIFVEMIGVSVTNVVRDVSLSAQALHVAPVPQMVHVR
jgi:hypothetical protein